MGLFLLPLFLMTDCTSPVCCLCETVVHKGEDYSDISVCFFIIIIPLYMKKGKRTKRDVLFPVRLHGGTLPVGPA